MIGQLAVRYMPHNPLVVSSSVLSRRTVPASPQLVPKLFTPFQQVTLQGFILLSNSISQSQPMMVKEWLMSQSLQSDPSQIPPLQYISPHASPLICTVTGETVTAFRKLTSLLEGTLTQLLMEKMGVLLELQVLCAAAQGQELLRTAPTLVQYSQDLQTLPPEQPLPAQLPTVQSSSCWGEREYIMVEFLIRRQVLVQRMLRVVEAAIAHPEPQVREGVAWLKIGCENW